MGKSFLQNGGIPQGTGPGAAPERAAAPAPLFGELLAAARPLPPRGGTPSPAHRRGDGTLRVAAAETGAECRRPGAGEPLTFSQSVLEVGVTSSLAVEVNAVPDEEGPAHTSGDGAIPAHHLLPTAGQGYGAREAVGDEASQRTPPLRRTPAVREPERPSTPLPARRPSAPSRLRKCLSRSPGPSAAMPERRRPCCFCLCAEGSGAVTEAPGAMCTCSARMLRVPRTSLKIRARRLEGHGAWLPCTYSRDCS